MDIVRFLNKRRLTLFRQMATVGWFAGSMCKVGYTLVTLPRIVTPYRDSVDGTRDRVTYQKLVNP